MTLLSNTPAAFPGAPVRDSMEKTIAGWLIAEVPDTFGAIRAFRNGDLRDLGRELRAIAVRLAASVPSEPLGSFAFEAIRFSDMNRVALFVREMWTMDDEMRMEQEQDRNAYPDVLTMNDAQLAPEWAKACGVDNARADAINREQIRRALAKAKGPTPEEREAIEEQSSAEDAANRRNYSH